MSKVIYVNDNTFEAQVLQADKPVLLDFWSETCPPCLMLAPILDELSEDFDGKLIIAKINTMESPQTAVQFGIRSIPTLIFFKDGKPTHTTVGLQPKANLAELINQQLSQ